MYTTMICEPYIDAPPLSIDLHQARTIAAGLLMGLLWKFSPSPNRAGAQPFLYSATKDESFHFLGCLHNQE